MSSIRRRSRGGASTSPRFRHSAEQQRMVTADDGVQLHVEIDGAAGPGKVTVVMAHGYGLSCRSWVLQRRALVAAGHRVVAYDQRGHGQSQRSAPEACTIDQLGADLRAVIEATCPQGPLALVGHSMGGMTVMALCGQHRELIAERVVAVALVASAAGGWTELPLGFGRIGDRVVRRLGHGVLGPLQRHRRSFDALTSLVHPIRQHLVERYSFASPVPADAVDFCAQIIFDNRLDTLDDFLYALEGHDERASLAVLDQTETLVLNGGGDLLTPPADSDEIAFLVPSCVHQVIPDAGHMLMLEHPHTVSDHLVTLIERGSLRAAEWDAAGAPSSETATDEQEVP